MRIEILYFEYEIFIHWLFIDLPHFCFWIITEKWWLSGNEHIIGIRFGSKVFEKRWG